MYGEIVCREATYIHHFIAFYLYLEYVGLIFTCPTILATELDTWHCLQDTCNSATVHVSHLTDCEHGGITPLTIHKVYDFIFNIFY